MREGGKCKVRGGGKCKVREGGKCKVRGGGKYEKRAGDCRWDINERSQARTVAGHMTRRVTSV